MKKTISASFLFLSACSAKVGLQTLEWKNGEPTSKISSLNEIDTTTTQKLLSKLQKVELAEQTIKDAIIEDSFVKSLKDQKDNSLLIRAEISLEKEKLNKLPIDSFLNKKETILNDIKRAFPIFQKNAPDKIDIVVAHRNGFYEPLWRLTYTDKMGLVWEVKMNNHLQVRSVKQAGSHFHDTLALVFPRGPKLSQLQEVTLKGIDIDPTLSSERVIVGSLADSKIQDASTPLKFNPQDTRFDQVQVFYFLEESLNWIEHRLGVKLPFKLNAEVHVGAPEKTNSAFYYQGKIRLGAGDDQVYSRIPQDPSIVIHESIHALVDAIARLPFEGEGGSLNEGFADFFTALQLDNPNMGETSYLKGPFKRSVANSYRLTDLNGGLYHDSGIVSGTLWEIRVKIGSEKAKEVAILTLNRLVPSSNFKDFGAQLKEVLPLALSKEDLDLAMSVVTARGF